MYGAVDRDRPEGLSRRAWLFAAAVGGWSLVARAAEPQPSADEEKEIADIQARAKKAGLRPFKYSMTEHYLGIGDAPSAYRTRALELCKSIGKTYQKQFHDKGF